MKTQERRQARELRTQGWSVKEIECALGVSRSSVSLWVRDIQLDDEHQRRLVANVTEGKLRAAERKATAARVLRRRYQENGRARHGTPGADYAAGCMLYWAEGGKGRNAVLMSNSDPELLRWCVEFLRSQFEVPDESVRVSCNLFADHVDRQREIEAFWLQTLRLPPT
jgi:predicted transcriptional regulator